MKLFGQVIGWAIVVAAVAAFLYAAIVVTLPPAVHP